jgi:hypothetical protein
MVIGRRSRRGPAGVGPRGAVKLTMHLDEARLGGRFAVLFTTAATLFGLFGLVSVVRGAQNGFVMPSHDATTVVRHGVMTERLRDCVTFERVQGETRVIVATSR